MKTSQQEELKQPDHGSLPAAKTITVLYTQKNSVYNQLGTDNWDKKRDAKNWQGGNAVIAHPPCRAWGNFKQWAKPEPGEKELAIHALEMVRKYGGILEHPVRSKLWKQFKLPTGINRDEYGGWTLNIDQKWFGHRAKKNTNLYIIGIEPSQIPDYTINLHKATHTVENMGKYERERTPIDLAKWLIKLAEKINYNNNKKNI